MQTWALVNHYGLNEFADRVSDGAILDVGPFFGDSTFAFARRFPNRPILCFEPDSTNRERLSETVSLNALTQVEIVPLGAGDSAARLPSARPGTAGVTVQPLATSDNFIDVDTLDNMVTHRAI